MVEFSIYELEMYTLEDDFDMRRRHLQHNVLMKHIMFCEDLTKSLEVDWLKH